MRTQKTLGVFTSGGGAPGMNAAIRGAVRMGFYLDCKVFFIYDGYKGMIDGNIHEATWEMVSNIIHKGGSVIGSLSCDQFRATEGRRKAVKNLITMGINNLICIGGSGSLQGLNVFKLEWPSLVDDLLRREEISADVAKQYPYLGVCGLVSSLDNDFWGTEMTIGFNTATARVLESVDAVQSTVNSEQRVFIVEVSGMHSGHLAITSGMACEADFVFVPEWPPIADWQNSLIDKLMRMNLLGRRLCVIVVAEGAVDAEGKKINSIMLKALIEQRLKYRTMITSLGEVQRGGTPSFIDRYLGTRMGAEATIACVQRDESKDPIFMALRLNGIERGNLTRAVNKTSLMEEAHKNRDLDTCIHLRGATFTTRAQYLDRISFPPQKPLLTPKYTLAILHVGNPAAGMNAATHAFVRMARYSDCAVIAAHNSWEGFENGEFTTLNWEDVSGWVASGGSHLGTSKRCPEKADQIAAQIMAMNIRGLVIVGGFEAFHSAIKLREWRNDFDSLRIPIVVIPATTCNNIPGVPEAIGTDTALNEICRTVDNIKTSARGHKKRALIVEVQGGYSGYLATMAAIATAADNAHTFEEELTDEDILDDVKEANQKLQRGVPHYLLLRTEGSSPTYTSRDVHKIFEKLVDTKFSCRLNVLGHSLEGGRPTAIDRQNAIRFGAKACERVLQNIESNTFDVECVGVRFVESAHADVQMLETLCCFVHNNIRSPWWLQAHGLMRVLSCRGEKYDMEVPPEKSENAIGFTLTAQDV